MSSSVTISHAPPASPAPNLSFPPTDPKSSPMDGHEFLGGLKAYPKSPRISNHTVFYLNQDQKANWQHPFWPNHKEYATYALTNHEQGGNGGFK